MKIFGVSVDSVESHKKFSDKHSFKFPLLADVGENICKAYGVNVKDGQYPERVTIVVDKSGTIKKVFPKVNPKEHAKEVLAALENR